MKEQYGTYTISNILRVWSLEIGHLVPFSGIKHGWEVPSQHRVTKTHPETGLLPAHPHMCLGGN